MEQRKIPKLALGSFRTRGYGLDRPEGICVDAGGTLWAADRGSLVARIIGDETTERFGNGDAIPNGLAVDLQGRILIAECGHGTLRRLDPTTGKIEMLVTKVEGRKIARANYPAVDPSSGRLWCTSSTSLQDDLAAPRNKIDDGFVFTLEPDGSSSIVGEGLHFANGLAFSKDFAWLYIVESSTRRIVRAPVLPGGRLGKTEPFGPMLEATPDGIAFDCDANLWVTLFIEKCALVIIDREASVHAVFEDPQGVVLGRPTNVCFGGADMCDLFVGSLDRDAVLCSRVGVPGLALPGQMKASTTMPTSKHPEFHKGTCHGTY